MQSESSRLQVVPIYFCYFTLGSILAGGIVMQEAVEMLDTPWKIPIFLIGAALLLFGVWIVTLGGQKATEPTITEELGGKKDGDTDKLVVEPVARATKRLSVVLPANLADQLKADPPKAFDKRGKRTSLTPGGAPPLFHSDQQRFVPRHLVYPAGNVHACVSTRGRVQAFRLSMLGGLLGFVQNTHNMPHPREHPAMSIVSDESPQL
jgi:hypothetical protein